MLTRGTLSSLWRGAGSEAFLTVSWGHMRLCMLLALQRPQTGVSLRQPTSPPLHQASLRLQEECMLPRSFQKTHFIFFIRAEHLFIT